MLTLLPDVFYVVTVKVGRVPAAFISLADTGWATDW